MSSIQEPHPRSSGDEPRGGRGGRPLVSVLIPAFDAGAALQDSVRSVLDQSHTELEVLVIDDGSRDGSVEALERASSDPRLRILRQANAGKSVALNRGLDELRGEYFALQDADDLSHPQRIERQVAALEAEPELAGVLCGKDLLLGERRIAPTYPDRDPGLCAAFVASLRMPGHDPTVCFRSALVGEMPFDPELRVAQGVDHLLRVGERFPLRVLPQCLYTYRVHASSNTQRSWQRRRRYAQRVWEKAYARRGIDPRSLGPELPEEAGREPTHCEADNYLAAHFIDSVKDLVRLGRRGEALRVALACLRLHPLDPYYARPLAFALLPRAVSSRLARGLRPPSGAEGVLEARA